MTGFLYTILEELGSITPEEVMNLVNQVVELAANHFVPKTNTKELKKAEPAKTAEEIKIENEKILELVNKFANYKNTAE